MGRSHHPLQGRTAAQEFRLRGTKSRRASGQGPDGKTRRVSYSLQALFWVFLQWCFIITTFVRAFIATVVTSRSLPPRGALAPGGRHGDDDATYRKPLAELGDRPTSLETQPAPAKVPVVAFRSWSALANLVELDVRMPWIVRDAIDASVVHIGRARTNREL